MAEKTAEKLKHTANIFLTVVLAASLSGCASIMEYWTVDENAGPAEGAAGAVAEAPAQTGEESPAQVEESGGETPVSSTGGAENTAAVSLAAPAGQDNANVNTQIDELRRRTEEARTAQEKMERELAESNKRIAELEAAMKAAAVAETNAKAAAAEAAAIAETGIQETAGETTGSQAAWDRNENAAAAAAQAAVAETARKKAEAELAAAQKTAAADLAAEQKKAAAAETARKKAETDLAAAQKKAAADLAAAQKKAAADLTAAQKKAAADLAAEQKKAAAAETARKKAEADLAAAQKKAADDQTARKKAEDELAAQLLSAETSRQNTAVSEAEQASQARETLVNLTIPPAASPQAAAVQVQTPPAGQANAVQVQTPPAGQAGAVQPEEAFQPGYYTVGVWPPDCFWSIAGFVYGNPYLWRVLYEANRDKLEDPDNPNNLKSGVILKIPPAGE
jgi:hypothetical protein